MSLRILAMDSSAPRGGAALLEGDRAVGRADFQGPEGHVVALPRAVAQLLAEAAWQPATLDLIAITLGPGSFSGLRIALGMAQGMALAHGTPLVGVSSLELLAMGVGEAAQPVAALLDARRGEVFAGLYRCRAGAAPQLLWGVETAPPQQLAAALAGWNPGSGPLRCVGSGVTASGELFRAALGDRFAATAADAQDPDPVVLGRLGALVLAERGPTAPGALSPLYQRQPEAVVKRAMAREQAACASSS